MGSSLRGTAAIIALAAGALFLPAPVSGQTQSAEAVFDGVEARATETFGSDAFLQAYRLWLDGQHEPLLKLVAPLAEQGDPQAQFLMGNFNSRGEGVPQDEERAAEWWRQAAEQGLAVAQNELGVALSDGRGVAPDPAQAVDWYRKAAEQGHSVAQANLALMYWGGLGVRKDYRDAVAWFEKAAQQGLGWAQFYLGEARSQGRGTARNAGKAVDWYRSAAEQDHTEAQEALGRMYLSDNGIRRDYARAAYWLARAASRGNERALTTLPVALARLRARHLPAGIQVRGQPDDNASVIRTTVGREKAHELGRPGDWIEVYFEDGHTIGYIRAGQLRGNQPAR